MWLQSLCSDLDLIENVQRAFTRRAFNKCHLALMDYCNRLVFLKQHTLGHLRVILSLCTFYDIYHKFVYCDIFDSFVCHNTSHVLRGHLYTLFITFVKLVCGKLFLNLYFCGTLSHVMSLT